MSEAAATAAGSRPSTGRLVVVAVAVAAVLVAVGGVLVAVSAPAPLLPPNLVGLPAAGGDDRTLARLERALRDDAAVTDVQGQVYDDGALRAAVLVVVPAEPLTDETAADLVSGVLTAAGEADAEPETRTSSDGDALLACAGGYRQACVTVEADRAVVAVTTGLDEDPLAWVDRVRADVVAFAATG